MQTTTLAVEKVIVGIQILAWITLYVLTVSFKDAQDLIDGYNRIDFNLLSKFVVPLTILLLGGCYTFGIALNTFWEFWSAVENRILAWVSKKFQHIADTRFLSDEDLENLVSIKVRSNDLAEKLESEYRTVLLMGNTAFNAIVFGGAISVFLIHFCLPETVTDIDFFGESKLRNRIVNISTVIAVTSVFSASSFATWNVLRKRYLKDLSLSVDSLGRQTQDVRHAGRKPF